MRIVTAITGASGALYAQRFLQGADVAADRTMGDMQFVRRAAHAAQAGGGLEGTQGVERRELARHPVTITHR